MKKILLLLFSVIVTLYGIDQRTRAWVINYLKGTDSTIDTVYMHYTDSLNVPILIVDNYIDGDSANFDHAVVNVHLYCDSAWFDDVVANWADIDTILGDTLDVTEASIDTLNIEMFIKNGLRFACGSGGGGVGALPETLSFYSRYKAGVIGGGQAGWGYIYSEGGDGDHSGDLVIDGGNIDDGASYARGNVLIRSPLVHITSGSAWWNNTLDTPGWVEIWGGKPDSSCIVVKTGQITFGDVNNAAWIVFGNDGSINATLSIVGDSLHGDHIVSDAQVTADSVDAQHVVADVSLLSQQTATVSFETATADTGLVITIDSINDGGGGDVANYGLVINGTGIKDGTQYPIMVKNRAGTALSYLNGLGNWYINTVYSNNIQTQSTAAAYFRFTHRGLSNYFYEWSGVKRGDYIIRDGHTVGQANADFFQIQDSVGDIQAQISNTGDATFDSVDAKKITVDTMHYATTVDKSIQISVTLPRLGTGAPPLIGVEDQFKTLDFDKATDEDVFFQVDIPSDYKTAGAIEIEVCFFVDGTVIGDTFVVWGCEYKTITHENAEVFDFDAGTATKLDTMTFSSGDAAKLYRESVISLVTTGFLVSDLLLCRIYRDANNAKDDYDGDARAVHFEMLYESDKPGRYN